MPTVKWNLSWARNLDHFNRGGIKGRYYGDQWGDPETEPTLRKVVGNYITPFVGKNVSALEIGSGGGRWTQYLLRCQEVYCVELNPEMFVYLERRFPHSTNLKFIRTTGSDFPNVPHQSIDFVFSFGTLVHLDFDIISEYLRNLTQVIGPNSDVIVQFSNKRKKMARDNPDFSDNDPSRMQDLFTRLGYDIKSLDDDLLPHSSIIGAKWCV